MQLLTVNDVAVRLNTSVPRVYAMIRGGLLPAVHLGRQIRVSEAALSEWIASGGKSLPGGWRQNSL